MFAKYAMQGRWSFGAPLPMFADKKRPIEGSWLFKYDLGFRGIKVSWSSTLF